LRVSIGTVASRLGLSGPTLRNVTNRGTVAAARIIVAMPTAAIAEERLRFDPPLPDKLAAASGLPLGLADKLFFHFEGEDIPERFLVGSTTRRETMSYQIRPFGRPRIQCFFGGRF